MDQPTVRRRRRKGLTDAMVAALPRKAKRYTHPDPEQRAMYVRVPLQGPASYVCVCRDLYGKQTWTTLGTADVMPIGTARAKAREVIARIKDGKPAFDPPPTKPETFQAVAENWFKRHVASKKMRTADDIESRLRKHVYPFWGEREFTSLRRSDIAELLDQVEDGSGKHQADYVLAIVRNISNWFASRHDDYLSPFTRGMRRVDPKQRKRSRILTDDELRALWNAAEADGVFGAFVRLALLTAQRRNALVRMKWSDLEHDLWRMSIEERAKGVGGDLKLPPMAMDIIRAQPRFAGNDYVFAGRRTGARSKRAPRSNGSWFNGFAKAKSALDKASGVCNWRIHDLRRTARSLMARAGVLSEHAERVMGHVVPGVEGIYDRHHYVPEKSAALAKLAALVEQIVRGEPGGNVVSLRPEAMVS